MKQVVAEACPICHQALRPGEAVERVPVCPLVYPGIDGLMCHERCLAAERERNRVLRREDLKPTLLGRRGIALGAFGSRRSANQDEGSE